MICGNPTINVASQAGNGIKNKSKVDLTRNLFYCKILSKILRQKTLGVAGGFMNGSAAPKMDQSQQLASVNTGHEN
jgi:hypothetical protein